MNPTMQRPAAVPDPVAADPRAFVCLEPSPSSHSDPSSGLETRRPKLRFDALRRAAIESRQSGTTAGQTVSRNLPPRGASPHSSPPRPATHRNQRFLPRFCEGARNSREIVEGAQFVKLDPFAKTGRLLLFSPEGEQFGESLRAHRFVSFRNTFFQIPLLTEGHERVPRFQTHAPFAPPNLRAHPDPGCDNASIHFTRRASPREE
jgi:hypothetical protein